MSQTMINFAYLISSILFIVGIKFLGSPDTARKGNALSALGMLLAVLVTLLSTEVLDYRFIVLGLGLGSVIGIFAARLVAMTAMPEMVALLNGFGGVASLLVGASVYVLDPGVGSFEALTIVLSVLIGGVTFTGSLVAWGKLSEKISGKPLVFAGQKWLNGFLLVAIGLCSVLIVLNPVVGLKLFVLVALLSFLLGIGLVVPIGGADMPVVISLLNSYSGLAACAAGFALGNNVLIVSGSLVGASGVILTSIMCKAMNRSLANVLFSGFGSGSSKSSAGEIQGEAKSISAADAYYVLEAAKSVVIVPGYGLAVAQAQHVVRELAEILEDNGADVKFAIHPVAGRMPGHMNVLLAEANVPYDQLVEMDDINPMMDSVDICMVIGANDVVNPAAREDESSPIYGMPVIEVDRAQNVFILKRSMASGFAGIANPLFYKDNSTMIFGDAKGTLSELVAQFKD